MTDSGLDGALSVSLAAQDATDPLDALPVRQPDMAVDPGAAAVAAGVGSRDPDGSVVFGQPAPSTDSARTFVQRIEDSAPPADPAPATAPAPAPANAAPQTGSAPAPAARPGAASHTEIEELARRLIDPLSAHLKAQLRLDRERAGLVTDLRR